MYMYRVSHATAAAAAAATVSPVAAAGDLYSARQETRASQGKLYILALGQEGSRVGKDTRKDDILAVPNFLQRIKKGKQINK